MTATHDLILLDYELPGMNGDCVLRELRGRRIKTPVILMTANGSEQLAIDVFRLGIANYLTKPFDLNEALDVIGDALQTTYLEKERQELLRRLVEANEEITAVNQELTHRINIMNVMYSIGKDVTLIHPTKTLEHTVEAAMHLTEADEGVLFLINRNTGQLKEPIRSQKTRTAGTERISTKQLSVPLEIGTQKVGALCVRVAQNGLTPKVESEYMYMLGLLVGYANIALQNLRYLEEIEARKDQEKQIIRGAFERYVDPQVVAEVLTKPNEMNDSRRQPVTTLFADLRGFSTFAHGVPPEETVAVINQYVQVAVEAIVKQRGTLDKFVGDAVMAFFNAPLYQEDHALQAVRSAVLLQQAAGKLYDQLPAEHRLGFGVGICTGDVVVGNVGAKDVLVNYTVMGDSVNKAKRLQEHARAGQILITEETLRVVRKFVKVRPVGKVILKGQSVEEIVYEVLGLLQPQNGVVLPPSTPSEFAVV